MTTDQQRQAFEKWWFDPATVDALENAPSVEAECWLTWQAAQPRVIDKAELKRLVCQVFGEGFQIVRITKLGDRS